MRLAAYCDAELFAGAERVLADLIAHLDPAIEVVVLGTHPDVLAELIRRRPGARAAIAGGIKGKTDLAGMRRWVGALRAVRPDVLHVNLAMPWAARHETLLATLMPGVRVVAVEHAPLPFTSGYYRRLKPLLTAGLAAHVAVGERAARDIESDVGLRPGSIRTIPVGVEPFEPPSRNGRDGSGSRIGTIARLDPLKRIDDLLRALSSLPGVELEVVGDGPERARLAALADSLGVSDRTRFPGWSDHPRSWLGRWDAFVLPSEIEGPSLVVIDAMLAELPVVATRVGSVPEAIRHEQTGLLVEIGDPDGLAAAVRRLLADPELGRRLGSAARAYALAHHDVEAMARGFEALYAEVLAPSH
jgi:glycosyltransferase involved in cell wall biosynthesis